MSEESSGRIRNAPSEASSRRSSEISSTYTGTTGSTSGSSDVGDSHSCGQDSREQLEYPGFVPVSLHCLHQSHPVRAICLRLITNPWFERISMLVILLNCITLGMYQPCGDVECVTNRCQTLRIFDDCIFAFFAVEMLIKITAMGITGRGAYMADTWNRLDSFIVIAGSLEYVLNLENMNITAIRTIRVLRPLRAINRIPSLRILVMLLLDTLPMLGNVLLLCFFVFFIFGIVGVQLWAGILRQRCFLQLPENTSYTGYLKPYYVQKIKVFKPLSNYYTTFEQDKDYICSLQKDNGMHKCQSLLPSRFKGRNCNGSALPFNNNVPNNSSCVNWSQYYTVCRAGDRNPFQGAISFDNIGLACIAIFLVISLEGWTDIMYYVQDAHSFWDWIYFVLLIVIGSFFMINLCLVVIATQFSETKKREIERMRLERARFQSCSTLASGSEPTGCYEEIIKYIAHLWRKMKREVKRYYRTTKFAKTRRKNAIALRRQQLQKVLEYQESCVVPNFECGSELDRRTQTTEFDSCSRECRVDSPLVPRASPEVSDIDLSSPKRSLVLSDNDESELRPVRVQISTSSNLNQNLLSSIHEPSNADSISLTKKQPQSSSCRVVRLKKPTRKKRNTPAAAATPRTSGSNPLTCAELLVLGGAQSAALAASLANDKPLRSLYNRFAKGERYFSAPQLFFYTPREARKCFSPNLSEEIYEDSSDEDSNWSSTNDDSPDGPFCSFYKSQKGKVKTVVDHKYFQNFILLSILVNTLSMGIEYHNQPDQLTEAVEASNMVFTGIFALEMLLKIIADGFFGYISNGFNLFDGVIVVLSVIDVCQSSNGGSGLSVLRTFRLLRILKLVRFMPALRRQLYVMLRTMDNVAVFFSLLILFIFIFSILGMNLFGCKFCRKASGSDRQCDRKNFDSLLWAIVTVFQILTQEDWNVVLFNGIEKTSHLAALYFVLLMTFGNYVLFNLLVAILVEGFSAEEEKKKCAKEIEEERKQAEKNQASLQDKIDKDQMDYEPKDNIEKEYKMMALPSVAVTKFSCNEPKVENFHNNNNRCGAKIVDTLPCAPVITRTAATPQGSPNATLEPVKDNKLCLSPEMVLNISSPSLGIDSPYNSSSSIRSSPCHSQSPNSKTIFLFPVKQSSVKQSKGTPIPPRRCLINSNIDNFNQPKCVSPQPMQQDCNKSLNENSPKLERRNSSTRSRQGSWKNRWRRKGAKESLVSDSDNSAGSDGESDSNFTLNNKSISSCSPFDHAHCNGGLPTIINTPNNKRNLTAQVNGANGSTGSCNISRQNSFKDSSNPQSPHGSSIRTHHMVWSKDALVRELSTGPNSLNCSIMNDFYGSRNLSPQHSVNKQQQHIIPSRQNSLTISFKDEYKPNNISQTNQLKIESEFSDPKSKSSSPKIKVMGLFEPRGCFKDKTEYSLFIFSPKSRLRIMCTWLNNKKWFDYAILFFIGLNCITLAMERPTVPPTSDERIFLSVANYSFTVIFAFEMFVKVVARGFWYGEKAYLKNGWNRMDGILVTVSLIDVFITLVANASPRIFGILRVFRLLRSLRPLRVINRAPGLKLVVQTLMSSLRPIGNIVLICCTFFIIFGILGVQLFKGSFYYCDGPDIKDVKNRTECLADPRNEWVNRKYNFDDLGQALMALFVLSSKDGWVNIMYNGLDAVGVDQQPQENFNEWRLLYFISFLLLVGFFVLNMFVGVVVENFHRCREEQEKEEKARRAVKRARKMEKKRRRMRAPPYYIKYSRPRLFIHSIVTSKYFDLAIAAVIGLNVVTMAMEFYKMPPELSYALRVFNYFFTAVFILESAMKTLALGSKRYIIDRWNQLDVIIVLLSIIGIVLEEMKSEVIPINPTIIRVMRVLRIARVLKLLKMAKGIRALLDTVMQALPQVGNLGLLFFLLFFIFAALGVELFGRLECTDEYPCQGLGEHAHFRNFGMAFLTLFRVATGDNWNGIMKDTLRDNCDSSSGCVRNCCVSPIITPLYFVIFVLMAQFVLVNVVVAVLMKHLEESHKQMDEEIDMDLEIERELAAEQQLEEVQQQREDALRVLRYTVNTDEDQLKYYHKPLYKISSLPSNFMFSGDGDSNSDSGSSIESTSFIRVNLSKPTSIISPPSTEITLNTMNDVQELFLTIPNNSEDTDDVNIKQPSPEGVTEKVAVADLSRIPSVICHVSPEPDSCDNKHSKPFSLEKTSSLDSNSSEIELPLLEGIRDRASLLAPSKETTGDQTLNYMDQQSDLELTETAFPSVCSCGTLDAEKCVCRTSNSRLWCVEDRESAAASTSCDSEYCDSKF